MTSRHSQIHLRQDEFSFTSFLTRDLSQLFCERESKPTPLKMHQQLVWGAQLEPTDKQTWCWSSASLSCSSCSWRILSSSACLCCSSLANLFSSSCLQSSSSRRAFSSVALLAISSLILLFPRYRLPRGYLSLGKCACTWQNRKAKQF